MNYHGNLKIISKNIMNNREKRNKSMGRVLSKPQLIDCKQKNTKRLRGTNLNCPKFIEQGFRWICNRQEYMRPLKYKLRQINNRMKGMCYS